MRNKEREPEAEDGGAGSRSCIMNQSASCFFKFNLS